jgi:hypothetical protein
LIDRFERSVDVDEPPKRAIYLLPAQSRQLLGSGVPTASSTKLVVAAQQTTLGQPKTFIEKTDTAGGPNDA